jgi:hypothetical protein
MRLESLGQVGLGFLDELLQLGDLSDFLEGADFVLLVTIHGKTRRVIATVLESRETCGMPSQYKRGEDGVAARLPEQFGW